MRKYGFFLVLSCAGFVFAQVDLHGGEKRISMGGSAGNPILPSSAFIPDGEPRIFEYQGAKRVFLYGSRDERVTGYCGYGHDVWSAPVDDLSQWTNHGEIFNVKQVQDIGYGLVNEQHFGAPDCVYNPVTKKYYLYTFLGAGYHLDGKAGPLKDATGTVPGYRDWGPKCVMARSDSPAGPFTDPVMCDWPAANDAGTFDPGVLVDEQEDGSVRIYAYWGMRKGDRCAEIDPKDMYTIIDPETRNPDRNAWRKTLTNVKGSTLFEASSVRRVAKDQYVFVYSANERVQALTYCYGSTPIGPWHYGGRIIDNGINWRPGNNHGGIAEINGKWYVFYHRPTSNNYNRQAMMEPIDVTFKGDRVVIPAVAMSSQASHTNGLNAFQRYNIDICCYSKGGGTIAGALRLPDGLQPMVGIKGGTELGFKYFDFGETPLTDTDDIRLKLNLQLIRNASMTIQVARPDTTNDSVGRIDVMKGNLKDYAVADGTYHDIEMPLSALDGNQALKAIGGLKGKLAVFLRFDDGNGELCRIKELEFVKGDAPTPNPLMDVRVPGNIKNGRAVALPVKARFGESVKLTVLPDAGFEAALIRVTDETGRDVPVDRNADVPHGPVSFHFTMPASPVVIEAGFKPVG